MYRDDTAAARLRLSMLERRLAHRRSARATLVGYRNALMDELGRLQHAIVWYENGERYGFNEVRARDDLSPARPLERASGDEVEAAVLALSRDGVATRTQEILAELAAADPRAEELRGQVRALETECERLRAEVAAWSARHPAHPPPPEYHGSPWTVAVPVAILLAILAAATLWSFGR